ncbi:DUF6151 family protein [Sedimentitalea nanhaiensis]|uniref:Uncharacterized conserved protein n=1 Tax=Sedimentitalea nanhaiensis TaxID=999627 RepID=A0A1I6ZFI9_9RHOB|nr:DUF6151 family protein [Sedimentitalea nanhaiensis]SFT61470.1 Uncharacterized conserved protein [Sedimentitalea nanhaiensis]
MVSTGSVAFSCTCGEVRGRISPATAQSGTHLICHCRDCRAAERFLEQPEAGTEGVELFQTTPDTIHLQAGVDRLAVLRLSPKGPLRWYASCCNTPLFNTLSRPGIPFVTAMVARISDPAPLGPVVAHSFVPQAGGPPKHRGGTTMVWRFFTRLGAARLSGRWRQTPFFDLKSGEPTAPVRLLTKQERAALYD